MVTLLQVFSEARATAELAKGLGSKFIFLMINSQAGVSASAVSDSWFENWSSSVSYLHAKPGLATDVNTVCVAMISDMIGHSMILLTRSMCF